MDPDTCLRELLVLAAEIIQRTDVDDDHQNTLDELIEVSELGMQLAEHAQNLDGWITKGGFVPARWRA